MKIKLPDILVVFLKSESIFDDYINELIHKLEIINKSSHINSKPYIDIMQSVNLDFKIKYYITDLFEWNGSIKGVDYWRDIAYKYNEYLKDNKIDEDYTLKDFING